MLVKIRRLIHRATRIQTACEAELSRLAREEDTLSVREEQFREKLSFLNRLMGITQLGGEQVDRSKIFATLRKIAVIQQNLAVTRMHLREVTDRRHALRLEQERQKEKRTYWRGRQHKYEYLKEKLLREKQRSEFRADETEQEERYNGQDQRRHSR